MIKTNILAVLLIAIILALMVPLSENVLKSDKAFTYDNLIFMNADIRQ